MQVNNSPTSFFDKFSEYTKDGKITADEYDSLKNLYKQQTGASDQDFEDTIAPTLKDLMNKDVTPTQSISDLIGNAVADGKLTYDEYNKIKDYYVHVLKIDPNVFDNALEYLIRKDILTYLKEHQDENIDVSHIKSAPDKTLEEIIEDALQKSIAKDILNGLVKMRTQDDFSEYTFRVLKREGEKLDEIPVV